MHCIFPVVIKRAKNGHLKVSHFGGGVAERKGFSYRTIGLLIITVLYKIFLSVTIFFPNAVLHVPLLCHLHPIQHPPIDTTIITKTIANIMNLFIAPSFDKNLFFCLYDNETVPRCSKNPTTPWPVTNQESLPAMITASHRAPWKAQTAKSQQRRVWPTTLGIWNSSDSKLWQVSYSSFTLSQGYSQIDGSSPMDDSDQDDDNGDD